jgi:hypothetical protein
VKYVPTLLTALHVEHIKTLALRIYSHNLAVSRTAALPTAYKDNTLTIHRNIVSHVMHLALTVLCHQPIAPPATLQITKY